MGYVLGRWFRRTISPQALRRRDFEVPAPSKLPLVTDDCWIGNDLLVAPILKRWFEYGDVNSTAVDIRWLISQLTEEQNRKGRFFYVKADQFLVWSRLPVLCEGDIIPARLEPRDEWVVYMAWVHFVKTRSPVAQKSGRIRNQYPEWLKRNFPEYEDPVWQ